MKYFWRVLALPFMTGLIGLFYIRLLLLDMFHFIKYGGELIKYRKIDINRQRKISFTQSIITGKLLKRGFSKDRITNNRGLIGATIDETMEYLEK